MSARPPHAMRYPAMQIDADPAPKPLLRPVRFTLPRAARIGELLAASISVLVTIILLTLMLLTCVDVVGRYFFGHPITGALEMTEVLLALLIFAGLPQVTARAEHVTIDMLDAVTSPRFQVAQRLFAQAITGLAFGFLSYRMWIRAEGLQLAGETTATLNIPMYPVVYAMSVLLGVSAVCALACGFTRRAPGEADDD